LCFPQDWFDIAGSNNVTFAVDLSSIDRVDNLIYCWTKITPNEDARLKEAQRLYEIKKDKKWLNYTHTLEYDVYDRSGRKCQTLSIVYYDTEGKSLYSNDWPELSINYERLIPGTIGMSVFDQLRECHIFEISGDKYEIYIEDVSKFLQKNPNAKYLGDTEWVKWTSYYHDSLDSVNKRMDYIRDSLELPNDGVDADKLIDTVNEK
jgi:hypothetical protein